MLLAPVSLQSRPCEALLGSVQLSSLLLMSILNLIMQISRAILGDDNRLRLPKFLEDEQKSPEDTKQVGCFCAAMLAASFGSAVGGASLLACAQSVVRLSSGSCHVGTLLAMLRLLAACSKLLNWHPLCPTDGVHPSYVNMPVQDLADKIAQLNSAIDEVSSRLKPEDRVANESIVDAS